MESKNLGGRPCLSDERKKPRFSFCATDLEMVAIEKAEVHKISKSEVLLRGVERMYSEYFDAVTNLIVLLSSTLYADVIQDARSIADKVAFILNDPTIFTLNDKLTLTFTSPAVMLQDRSFESTSYYSFKDANRFTSAPSLDGVYCTIKNITDKVVVIKWSQSTLTVGSFSGIPLLDNMPSHQLCPITVLLPDQAVDKSLYVPC